MMMMMIMMMKIAKEYLDRVYDVMNGWFQVCPSVSLVCPIHTYVVKAFRQGSVKSLHTK